MIDLEAIAERDRVHKDGTAAHWAACVADRRQLLEHVRELRQAVYDAEAFNKIHKEQLDAQRQRLNAAHREIDRLTDHARLRPRSEWTEEEGDVLWHRLPVAEPPYCGTPLCCDWPEEEGSLVDVGYFTHFQRLPPVPKEQS